jgi:hypothetical protein
MSRRLIDAFALLAFPLSVYVAGWLLPRSDPLDGGITGAPVALMIATIALGAATSVALAIAGRRIGRARPRHEEPETVRWLIMGWPLPMPKWRTRTGPDTSHPMNPGPER